MAKNPKLPLQKLTKVLEGLTDPSKLIKALFPFNGSFYIDYFEKVPYDGKIYDTLLIAKELETEKDIEAANLLGSSNYTLLDVMGLISLGNIEIKGEILPDWHGLKEVIAIYIRSR